MLLCGFTYSHFLAGNYYQLTVDKIFVLYSILVYWMVSVEHSLHWVMYMQCIGMAQYSVFSTCLSHGGIILK